MQELNNKDIYVYYSRYGDKRILQQIEENLYLFFGVFSYYRCGGDKNDIQYIDPDGGPFIGKETNLKHIFKINNDAFVISIKTLEDRKFLIKTQLKKI